MESYEASRAVFTRVQNIDPENASKIMGYILLHHGENDMIHLAYGPETLILSLVNRAKTDLGLSSNTSCASVVNPISNPISISRPNPLSISLSSSGLSNGFDPSSPSSPSIWSPHHVSQSPINATHNLSYAAVVANNNARESNNINLLDDFHLKDQNLGPFLSDPLILPAKNVDFSEQSVELSLSPGCNNDSMMYPSSYLDNNNTTSSNIGETNGHNLYHRRSSSFNDNLLSMSPCLYYTRGFCKNGSACNFVHGSGFSDDNCGGLIVGSPCNYDAVFEQRQEQIFRSKLAQQHRLAAQLINCSVTLPYNKLNFLHSEAQRSAAALMMSEEFNKLNRVRMARHELLGLDCNPASRQIYLTFPADSTFKEEDVSNYFNKFGPVQDVRIPYQQKRMFGFVTFVFPETVKIILAKGNPHFVCDSRVLVKPYKEKGKLPDKKQHQHHFERGEFSCSSSSEHDFREPYDFQLGGRMINNTQEMLLRKKLEEQAEFHHVLELQERRLMNLQLLDLKNKQHQPNASVGSPVESLNQTTLSLSNDISQDVTEENKESPTVADVEFISEGVNIGLSDSNVLKKESSSPNREEDQLLESFDHVLPDNLFASPTKSSSDIRPAAFIPALTELDIAAAIPGASSTPDNDSALPATSSPNTAPLKSCFSEMPRISTEHGALGM